MDSTTYFAMALSNSRKVLMESAIVVVILQLNCAQSTD
jgi:hypothetical protein